jgi:hypothetical protein
MMKIQSDCLLESMLNWLEIIGEQPLFSYRHVKRDKSHYRKLQGIGAIEEGHRDGDARTGNCL